MKIILTLFLVASVLVGCEAVSTPENVVPAALPLGTAGSVIATEVSPNEVSLTETHPIAATPTESPMNGISSNSEPNGIIVKPPMVPVEPIPNPLAGWQTLSSTALGVSVDYPAEWSAIEQADVVTFTSPQGSFIQLQLITMNGNQTVPVNQQCATLINAYGLSVDTCVDTSRLIYSARFSMPSNNPSTKQLLLSTTSKDALDVYTQMLDSLRLNQ